MDFDKIKQEMKENIDKLIPCLSNRDLDVTEEKIISAFNEVAKRDSNLGLDYTRFDYFNKGVNFMTYYLLNKLIKIKRVKMIAAIHGKKQTGKDTVGKIIQALVEYNRNNFFKERNFFDDEHFAYEYLKGNNIGLGMNPHFKIRKFAEKLKEIVSILTNIPVSEMEKEEVKNKVLPKMFWVYKIQVDKYNFKLYPYTKYKNKFPKDTLIKPTLRYYLKYIGTDLFREQLHPDIFVYGLMQEYSKDKRWIITDLRFKNGFYTVKEEGGITIKVVRNTNEIDNHKSENDLNDVEFDYTIDNNGSIEELIKKVKEILVKEKIL